MAVNDWLPLVSTVGGTAVGLAGVYATLRAGRRQQNTASTLARQEREQRRLEAAYGELIAWVNRIHEERDALAERIAWSELHLESQGALTVLSMKLELEPSTVARSERQPFAIVISDAARDALELWIARSDMMESLSSQYVSCLQDAMEGEPPDRDALRDLPEMIEELRHRSHEAYRALVLAMRADLRHDHSL